MIEEKTKVFFKHKRIRNIRFSSDIIYVSKAKIKHTNNKVTIILYVYNKQKDIIQRNIKNIVKYMYNIPGLIKLRVLNRIPKKSILFYI
jgi:cellulose synthase/poly-beta-1,6-N-acetylglucosamine synthase-like glycosyltransferase